ncbi:MAG: hypothetical protein HUK26_08855, partial [Duodenibacillus sp.]|nr:hypothetical protein [Duodenibacillus sp.]
MKPNRLSLQLPLTAALLACLTVLSPAAYAQFPPPAPRQAAAPQEPLPKLTAELVSFSVKTLHNYGKALLDDLFKSPDVPEERLINDMRLRLDSVNALLVEAKSYEQQIASGQNVSYGSPRELTKMKNL